MGCEVWARTSVLVSAAGLTLGGVFLFNLPFLKHLRNLLCLPESPFVQSKMGMGNAYSLPKCWAGVHGSSIQYLKKMPSGEPCHSSLDSEVVQRFSNVCFSSTIVHVSITSIHKQCTTKPHIFFLAQNHSSRFYLQTQQL